MRQWGGVQLYIAIVEVIDICVVAVRHELKIAEG